MNPAESSESLKKTTVSTPEIDITWVKQLFAKNPFYIISAALLLYGIYRLSIDPKVFATFEEAQLLFNFGSFQFYEFLLVGTAIFLARRKIWYDSTLLVWLENLFVFIPFILISQASLFDENKIAMALCFGGCALAVVRFGSLKKFFLELELPGKLLSLGVVLLVTNVALPLIFRGAQKDANSQTADSFFGPLNEHAWLFVLPVLLGLANLLPKPRSSRGDEAHSLKETKQSEPSHVGSYSFERSKDDFTFFKRWFPLAMFAVWTLVTGVHLYCINYVYGLKWSFSFLLPTLWLASWTLWNRIGDFVDNEAKVTARKSLLFLPIVIALLAVGFNRWTMLLTFTTLNAMAYGALFIRQRNKLALQLLLASVALMAPGIPQSFFAKIDLHFLKTDLIKGSLAAYVIFQSILSRNPKMGLLGSSVAGITTAVFFHDHRFFANVGAQVGFIFLLIHSLRWEDDKHSGAAITRVLIALMWIGHSFLWLVNKSEISFWTTSSFALVTIAVYFAVKFIFGFWGPRVVPYAALLVLFCKPSLLFVGLVKDASTGLLAVAASFVLFAFGTIAALTKNHWNKNERFVAVTTQTNSNL